MAQIAKNGKLALSNSTGSITAYYGHTQGQDSRMVVLKIILGIIITLVFVIVAGLKGWFFPIWPTSFPDQKLEINATKIKQLNEVLEKPKFYESDDLLYPGAYDEETR
ncbi:MAG: hypothetical protein ACFHVJ_11305 [Aestuariibacter sp.]